jgi:hypothetical protein
MQGSPNQTALSGRLSGERIEAAILLLLPSRIRKLQSQERSEYYNEVK